jgi:hypothetical protein
MYLALGGELSDPGGTLLKLRALQSFDRGAARYAIHRTVRCAVRRPLDEVFDDLALLSDLVAQRMDSTSSTGLGYSSASKATARSITAPVHFTSGLKA